MEAARQEFQVCPRLRRPRNRHLRFVEVCGSGREECIKRAPAEEFGERFVFRRRKNAINDHDKRVAAVVREKFTRA